MRHWVLMGGAAVAVLTLAITFSTSEALAKYEEPSYSVITRERNIEVRQYPDLVAAQVTVDGSERESANNAFGILAGYIFGKNKARTKIAMTVPVTQNEIPAPENAVSQKIAMTVPVTTQPADGKMQMSFFMPSKYSLDTLPVPTDERIKLSVVNSMRYAVIKFSGFAHEGAIEKQTAKLLNYIRTNHFEPDGAPRRAFYNPPWTPPFLRRNEVWIPIKSQSST